MRDTQPGVSDENVELVRRGFMATMEEDWQRLAREAVGLPD